MTNIGFELFNSTVGQGGVNKIWSSLGVTDLSTLLGQYSSSTKRARLHQASPTKIEISGWSWPTREHLGQAVKQLLRLGFVWLKALKQNFSQAELGRRLSQSAISQKGSACHQASQTWVTFLLYSDSFVEILQYLKFIWPTHSQEKNNF